MHLSPFEVIARSYKLVLVKTYCELLMDLWNVYNYNYIYNIYK